LPGYRRPCREAWFYEPAVPVFATAAQPGWTNHFCS